MTHELANLRHLPPPRCDFGLCRDDAEVIVQPAPNTDARLVCRQHLVPSLSWGTVLEVEPLSDWLYPRPAPLAHPGTAA